MSGGAFDYKQHHIGDIIDRIEEEIHDATKPRPATQTVKYAPVYEMLSDTSSRRLEYHHINHCEDLDEVRRIIKKNNIKVIEDKGDRIIFEENGKTRYTYAVQYEEYPPELDDDGYTIYPYYPDYTEETIAEFRKAVSILKMARTYAQSIDWLLSGDYGEEKFHERLREELGKLENGKH